MSKEYMNDGSLSEKWKYRFNFYDQHGFPGFWGATPEYKAAFKALKVRQRLTIQMNFIAFFCSWIYLFVLGLWKKATPTYFSFFGFKRFYNFFTQN